MPILSLKKCLTALTLFPRTYPAKMVFAPPASQGVKYLSHSNQVSLPPEHTDVAILSELARFHHNFADLEIPWPARYLSLPPPLADADGCLLIPRRRLHSSP